MKQEHDKAQVLEVEIIIKDRDEQYVKLRA